MEAITYEILRKKELESENVQKLPSHELLTMPKHILSETALFEWEMTNDDECCCGHRRNSQHLDGIGICLHGLCICENFLEKGSKVRMPQKDGKLPKKIEQKQAGEGRHLSYIETLIRI